MSSFLYIFLADTIFLQKLLLLSDAFKGAYWYLTLNCKPSSFLPFAAYRVKSGGIFKHTSENAETVNKDEVDFLVQKERDFAEYYTRRFVAYICFDSSKFPEYTSNTESDVYPDKDVSGSNWVL